MTMISQICQPQGKLRTIMPSPPLHNFVFVSVLKVCCRQDDAVDDDDVDHDGDDHDANNGGR